MPARAEMCNAIVSDSERLACWDKAFPPTPPLDAESSSSSSPPTQAPSAPVGQWVLEYEKSKLKDTQDVYASISSNDKVPDRYNANSEAVITIRCQENTTAVAIFFGGAFMSSSDYSNYGDVTYRVDKKPAVTKGFEESTNNRALGLWSGGSAIPFIKQLFGGSSLVLRATPYNENPVELEFDITGIDAAVSPVRKACGW